MKELLKLLKLELELELLKSWKLNLVTLFIKIFGLLLQVFTLQIKELVSIQ